MPPPKITNAQNSHLFYLQEIPGEPGVDYPTLGSVPDTDFSCEARVSGGFYNPLLIFIFIY